MVTVDPPRHAAPPPDSSNDPNIKDAPFQVLDLHIMKVLLLIWTVFAQEEDLFEDFLDIFNANETEFAEYDERDVNLQRSLVQLDESINSVVAYASLSASENAALVIEQIESLKAQQHTDMKQQRTSGLEAILLRLLMDAGLPMEDILTLKVKNLN